MTHQMAVRHFVFAFLALLVLTAATTGAAYFDLGPWNSPIALAIALAKATIVAIVFMRLPQMERGAYAGALIGGFLFVVLIVITTIDAILTT